MNILWKPLYRKKIALSKVLRQTFIFHDLTRSQVKKVSNTVYVRKYSPGEFIFYKGDPSSAMYVVLKGQVDVTINNKILATLKSGEFFGEIALLDDAKRTASAVAKVDVIAASFMR